MYLDIILLLLLVLCMVIGVMRGVLTPLITFFSLVLSVCLTVMLLNPCLSEVKALTSSWQGNFLVTLITSKFVMGLLLILILYFTLTSLAEFIKRKLVNALNLKFSDRFLGMLCGAAVGIFLCLMLCVGLMWSRTLVNSQANSEGQENYDSFLQSSNGYSISLAIIGKTVSVFPRFGSILPEGKLFSDSSSNTADTDFDEDDERGILGH